MTQSQTHDDHFLLIHAYLDGELDLPHALDFEQRMAADPALAAAYESTRALTRLVHDHTPRRAAPPDLVRRIESAVGLRHTSPRQSISWRILAAAAVLASVMAGDAIWVSLRPGPADAVPEMVVASHMRALMAPQPIDVSSSDRHTVKPWFNGRIPQSPHVVDLTNEGFPLVGGRIDVIGRVPVPTLVYRHRQHLISLMAVPAASDDAPGRRTIAGHNTLDWSEHGTRYWAVSDLSIGDLETFAKAFRAAGTDR